MPIESDSDVTSSGSSSTVNVTVEETSGDPGVSKRYVDVVLHIEPGRFNAPASAPAGSNHYEPSGIDVWWKDLEVIAGTPVELSLELAAKAGWFHRGKSNYVVTVTCDSPKTIQVHEGCVYNWGKHLILWASAERFKLVPIERPPMPKPPSPEKA